MSKEAKPNYIWSMLTTKCPRCRRGSMFTNSNPWNLKETLKMPDKCPECGQPFELEVGFWYGTGYVSYALTVVISGLSLIMWWLLIGLSTEDNRFFWWLGTNSVLLIFYNFHIQLAITCIFLYDTMLTTKTRSKHSIINQKTFTKRRKTNNFQSLTDSFQICVQYKKKAGT